MISAKGNFIGRRFPGGYRFKPGKARTKFGRMIVEACEYSGVSIPELAFALNMSYRTLSKWAAGVHEPPELVQNFVINELKKLFPGFRPHERLKSAE